MSSVLNMQTAKNSKLFKKFMQNKNKSAIIVNTQQKTNNSTLASMSMPGNDYSSSGQPSNYGQAPTRRRAEGQQNQCSNLPSGIQEAKLTLHEAKWTGLQQAKQIGLGEPTQYHSLAQDNLELKEQLARERLQSRRQILKWEQERSNMNRKVFELRTHEDELIIDNKSLKEKIQGLSNQKKELEELNRVMNCQLAELREALEGQQSSEQQKEGHLSYWKKQNQQLKIRVRELEQQIGKLKDSKHMLEREKQVEEKQAANREVHLDQMRQKIGELITQNGDVRDQLFLANNRMYQFQQENKVLRAEIKRKGDDLHTSYYQPIVTERRSPSKSLIQPSTCTGNTQPQGERRRGEFARERNSKKSQIPPTPVADSKQREALARLEQLGLQLQKLKDSKAMNGGMRRQKINIQRQMQQIQDFLKSSK